MSTPWHILQCRLRSGPGTLSTSVHSRQGEVTVRASCPWLLCKSYLLVSLLTLLDLPGSLLCDNLLDIFPGGVCCDHTLCFSRWMNFGLEHFLQFDLTFQNSLQTLEEPCLSAHCYLIHLLCICFLLGESTVKSII